MSGEIVDLSQVPSPGRITADVVVIGSGPGGATAARVLAEAGHDVVILEEGGDYIGAKLTQRDGAMYDQLYMDRGGRSTDDLSISVLQGRVLGGGAVINASDVVPMHDATRAYWRNHFGLTDLTDAAMAPFDVDTLRDLAASPIEESALNENNKILRRGAEALSIKGEVMHHNRVGCAGLGTCLIGCPLNAKRNPRMVSIPKAVAAGARVFIRARATRIDDVGQEFKRIRVRTLDAKGHHERDDVEVRARVVIVAANPVNTIVLLMKSGVKNPHLGRHLSLQPQLPVVARFKDPVHAYRGIPQAYAVTEGEVFDEKRGLLGFRIEPIMGTPGIVSSLLTSVGPALKEAMTHYPNYAASLCLVPDVSSGTISVRKDGRPSIQYTHLDEHKQRTRDAAKLAARIYLAAGCLSVEIPLHRQITITSERDLKQIDDITFAPCTAPFISAHQQGGARMGNDPKAGVTNPDALVFGTRDIYAFDSSTFPSSSSSHTMAPITSFSRFQATKLLAVLRR